MSRTYWKQKAENTFEFLGAYQDGHTMDPKRHKNAPQFGASVLDFQGMTIDGTLNALGERTLLVDLPLKVRNRLQAKIPTVLEWGQIEGFLK